MRESGNWFPQGTTLSIPVEAELENEELVIALPHGRPLRYMLVKLRVIDRMAGLPLKLFTEDGGMLELADGPLAKMLTKDRRSVITRLEQIMVWVFLVVMLWAFAVYGVPYLAGRLAPHFPMNWVEGIGERTFDSLDSKWGLEENNPDAKQELALAKIKTAGGKLAAVAGGPWNYRFYLDTRKDAPPNAFALPSGQIIMSYSLYEKLAPEEVAAVLAHEIAHVQLRHSLQALVSASFWRIFSLALTDSVLTTLPGLALLSYSRTQELEADCSGALLLHKSGRDPQDMREALLALQRIIAAEADTGDYFSGIWKLISSHPEFDVRITQAQECAGMAGVELSTSAVSLKQGLEYR